MDPIKPTPDYHTRDSNEMKQGIRKHVTPHEIKLEGDLAIQSFT
jgi:hypothetical protein